MTAVFSTGNEVALCVEDVLAHYIADAQTRVITVYADRSFSFETKSAPATYFIKKAANLKSGSATTGKGFIGKIKRSELAKIAEIKMADLNANDIEMATRTIEGSARSMGLEVVEG